MVIPRFVGAALGGRRLEIFGDGNQTRCFCHVQDTIRALAGLMGATGLSGEIYNVGSQESISILGLAERVLAATGSRSELTHVPFEEAYGQGIEDMLHRKPGLAKIGAAIGWEPTIALDGILADVIAYERSKPVLVES